MAYYQHYVDGVQPGLEDPKAFDIPDYQCFADRLSNQSAMYASTAVLPLCNTSDFIFMEAVLRGADSDNPLPSSVKYIADPHDNQMKVCPLAIGKPNCYTAASSRPCGGNRDLRELPNYNRFDPLHEPHQVRFNGGFEMDSRVRDDRYAKNTR